ncbi:MAG: AAA family ATPase [Balneolales bacterium]|nr:AAA family ATPase [Balneolales bacterium]
MNRPINFDLLFEISGRLVENTPLKITRELITRIRDSGRLTGIKGARGVGKTTLLLQYAKQHLKGKKYLYVSLDDILFSEIRLTDFADDYVKMGGQFLLLDEVHSYSGWAKEIKNIFDRYTELNIVFTGSSMIQLSEGLPELSRRAVILDMPGLSLREYIQFSRGINFEAHNIVDILYKHTSITPEIWKKIKPIEVFNEYLKSGYYPYYFEHPETYDLRLKETVIKVLESDLLITAGISYTNVDKLKKLLYIISHSVPFKPNIDKLSSRLGIGKNTLKQYLKYLDMASITSSLFSAKKGISMLTKPEKIYLHHPNIAFSLAPDQVQIGTLRESFLLNQLTQKHTVRYPESGDFWVDDTWLIEVGGKNKNSSQLEGYEKGWLAVDGIESGRENRVPLWLFGFLY